MSSALGQRCQSCSGETVEKEDFFDRGIGWATGRHPVDVFNSHTTPSTFLTELQLRTVLQDEIVDVFEKKRR
jgi:hypothetical protein